MLSNYVDRIRTLSHQLECFTLVISMVMSSPPGGAPRAPCAMSRMPARSQWTTCSPTSASLIIPSSQLVMPSDWYNCSIAAVSPFHIGRHRDLYVLKGRRIYRSWSTWAYRIPHCHRPMTKSSAYESPPGGSIWSAAAKRSRTAGSACPGSLDWWTVSSSKRNVDPSSDRDATVEGLHEASEVARRRYIEVLVHSFNHSP
ncbi:hypothetical protein F5X99DRAFT_367807 [Biscogniauxia marginata]|nr:hypothetical protein F5X99DRAFT_367807 [Biscogniauxia marginata]